MGDENKKKQPPKKPDMRPLEKIQESADPDKYKYKKSE